LIGFIRNLQRSKASEKSSLKNNEKQPALAEEYKLMLKACKRKIYGLI